MRQRGGKRTYGTRTVHVAPDPKVAPVTIRVLLVDDEPELRLLLRTTLELHGAFSVVDEIETTDRILPALVERQPNLMVLDLGLRDGDAGPFVKEVRAASPSTVLVVLSAQPSEIRESDVIKDGAHAYYEKRPDTIRAFPHWLEDLHTRVAGAA